MKKYEVIEEFWKGGRRRVVGSTVQLTPREARNLASKVKPVEKKQPRKSAQGKGGVS